MNNPDDPRQNPEENPFEEKTVIDSHDILGVTAEEMQDAQSCIKIGMAFLAENNNELALIAFQNALALDPDNKEALELKIIVLMSLERFKIAHTLLERFANKHPHEAMRVVTEQLNKHPADTKLHSMLGELHQRRIKKLPTK